MKNGKARQGCTGNKHPASFPEAGNSGPIRYRARDQIAEIPAFSICCFKTTLGHGWLMYRFLQHSKILPSGQICRTVLDYPE
jgi:hypothetical protein